MRLWSWWYQHAVPAVHEYSMHYNMSLCRMRLIVSVYICDTNPWSLGLSLTAIQQKWNHSSHVSHCTMWLSYVLGSTHTQYNLIVICLASHLGTLSSLISGNLLKHRSSKCSDLRQLKSSLTEKCWLETLQEGKLISEQFVHCIHVLITEHASLHDAPVSCRSYIQIPCMHNYMRVNDSKNYVRYLHACKQYLHETSWYG